MGEIHEPPNRCCGTESQERGGIAMSIRKHYYKDKPLCRVTFCLHKEAAFNARHVHLVGEFNNWNIYATPMKKLEDGSFTVHVELRCGKEYQFRYLINEATWENDWKADKYVSSLLGGCDNSVVVIEAYMEQTSS